MPRRKRHCHSLACRIRSRRSDSWDIRNPPDNYCSSRRPGRRRHCRNRGYMFHLNRYGTVRIRNPTGSCCSFRRKGRRCHRRRPASELRQRRFACKASRDNRPDKCHNFLHMPVHMCRFRNSGCKRRSSKSYTRHRRNRRGTNCTSRRTTDRRSRRRSWVCRRRRRRCCTPRNRNPRHTSHSSRKADRRIRSRSRR